MCLEISSLESIHGRLTARFPGVMGLLQLPARTAKAFLHVTGMTRYPSDGVRTFLTSVGMASSELPPWRMVGSDEGAFEEENGVSRCDSNTLDTASLLLSCVLQTSTIKPKS